MKNKIHDLVIIGAGPSALTAAVYTTREDIDTVIYEKGVIGGLVATIDHIDNYPGFENGIDGYDLAEQFEKQARRFGAQIEIGEVKSIKRDGDIKIVNVDGDEVRARSILICSGSSYRKLGIKGELENYGKGVHYCATCDGAFYRGKKIVVVGGGNSAVQEAMFLTRFATHIDLFVLDQISATEILQKELQIMVDEGKITVHLNTVTTEIIASDGHVTSILVEKDGASQEIRTDGIFVFIGLVPNTKFLEGSGIELDERGFVKTNHELETCMPGVFASGDVRSGATMQIASAVGEGTTAALSISEYLRSLR